MQTVECLVLSFRCYREQTAQKIVIYDDYRQITRPSKKGSFSNTIASNE